MGSTLGRGRATGKVRFHGAIVVRFGAQDSPHADRARKAPFRGPLEVQWLTCRAAPGMKKSTSSVCGLGGRPAHPPSSRITIKPDKLSLVR